MHGKRAIKKITNRKACGHAYCTDCKTRRGQNRGNRNIRHFVKTVLHVNRDLP